MAREEERVAKDLDLAETSMPAMSRWTRLGDGGDQ